MGLCSLVVRVSLPRRLHKLMEGWIKNDEMITVSGRGGGTRPPVSTSAWAGGPASGHEAVLSVVLWLMGVVCLLSPIQMVYVGSSPYRIPQE